jgi:branched-chain amino acid transport system substrate-binding protein
MRMLVQAIKEANSDEPKAVAAKLEGMKFKTFDGGDAYMRKEDHQFIQDMYIASFGPLDPGAKYDEEKTGWGWKNAGIVKAKDTELPTTCKMDRPS